MRLYCCLLIIVNSLAGCNKPGAPSGTAPPAAPTTRPATVLNEDTAGQLIKESLPSAPFTLSTTMIQPFMAESATEYAPLPGTGTAGTPNEGEGADTPQEPMPAEVYLLRRLIGDGLVKSAVKVNSYPVISGTWAGINTCVRSSDSSDPAKHLDYVLANQNATCFKFPLTLQLQPVSNSNRVSGTSNRGTEAWAARPLEASVTPDNRLIFHRLDGPQGAEGPFTYIERGERAYLVGRSDYLYSGTASRKRAEVKTYTYAFRPDLGQSNGRVPAGKYEIGAVSNLLLTIDTRAEATFAWSVSLNPAGKAMMEAQGGGVRGLAGTGRAEFAKKPDGTWVLVPPLRF